MAISGIPASSSAPCLAAHATCNRISPMGLAVDLAVLFWKDSAAEGKCWLFHSRVTSAFGFITQDKPLSRKQFCWDCLRWPVKSDSIGHGEAAAHGRFFWESYCLSAGSIFILHIHWITIGPVLFWQLFEHIQSLASLKRLFLYKQNRNIKRSLGY